MKDNEHYEKFMEFKKQIEDENLFDFKFKSFFQISQEFQYYNHFWDAIIGSLFLDGGFDAMCIVLGRIYGPFFNFF